MTTHDRRLCWHGLLLFLLGLLSGLAVQAFANPRMGLAAHLEGLLNGIFLLALGSAWPRLRLSARAARTAFRAVLYGGYANWACTTFAAIFGTRALTPLAAGAHHGRPWQEWVAGAGFASVGLAMLVAAGLLLWGFRAPRDGGPAGQP